MPTYYNCSTEVRVQLLRLLVLNPSTVGDLSFGMRRSYEWTRRVLATLVRDGLAYSDGLSVGKFGAPAPVYHPSPLVSESTVPLSVLCEQHKVLAFSQENYPKAYLVWEILCDSDVPMDATELASASDLSEKEVQKALLQLRGLDLAIRQPGQKLSKGKGNGRGAVPAKHIAKGKPVARTEGPAMGLPHRASIGSVEMAIAKLRPYSGSPFSGLLAGL